MIDAIVSGGQTGADRAALDVASRFGIARAGWVPKDRWAEDGPIPVQYSGLRETASADPRCRTWCNVRDSDGTVVLFRYATSGGTRWTEQVCRTLQKPWLSLDLAVLSAPEAAQILQAWIRAEEIRRLNVAGPRASEDDRIHGLTYQVLVATLQDWRD